MPPDQSCLHAKRGPSEPCLGSHVSLGPGIWPFWGALGAILSVGDRFCLLGTQPRKKAVLAVTRRHWGDFGEIFGSSEARSHCATFVLSRLPMVRPPAAAIRDLLVFGGSGGLREISRPCWGHGHFGRNSAPPGSFLGDFWLIGTAFALRNFLTLKTLGGFTRVF